MRAAPAAGRNAAGRHHRSGSPPPVAAGDLGHVYPGGRSALAGVDLHVGCGEAVLLLGPNGSGKSTLVRILATALPPTRGRLSLLGHPVRPGPRIPSVALRRRISLAGDLPVHVDALPALDNAVLLARAAGLSRVDALARAEEMLERMGLAPEKWTPVGQYSFGMRRRLLLAEAFLGEPELVLLDEPTVGLDPGGVDALLEQILARSRAGGAVVVATNDTSFAARAASRVVFLVGGKVVADAPPEELLAAVQETTEVELRLQAPAPERLPQLPGVSVRAVPGGLLAEGRSVGFLPDLCRLVLELGGRPTEVRVREPDLGDAFRHLTGESLVVEAATEVGQEEGLRR